MNILLYYTLALTLQSTNYWLQRHYNFLTGLQHEEWVKETLPKPRLMPLCTLVNMKNYADILDFGMPRKFGAAKCKSGFVYKRSIS